MARLGYAMSQTMVDGLMKRSGQSVCQLVPNWDNSEIGTDIEIKRPNTCMYSYYYDVCVISTTH